jgi:hypothetical protein
MKMEAAAIAYVRYVLNVLQLTPSAMAKRAKISSTTITRALNDPKHKFTLSMTTLEKIADASGIPIAPFLDSEDQVNLAVASNHPPRAFEFGPGGRSPTVNRQTPFSAMIVVIGEVSAGYWQDPTLAANSYTPLFLALIGTAPKDTFACIARGTGAMPIAANGEYLVCRRLFPGEDISSLSGRTVVVQARAPKDPFKIELTARLLQAREKGFDLLTFDSKDWKKRLSTVHLDKVDQPGDISILGLVEYVVREPGPTIEMFAADEKIRETKK